MIKCPKCKSESVSTEKRPNGNSICRNCGYRNKTKDFDNDKKPQNKITKAQIAKDIKQSCIVSERLGELSNQEIAKLLIDHVWADMDFLSSEADLLEEAIERLKK